jgi:hypothetical protein
LFCFFVPSVVVYFFFCLHPNTSDGGKELGGCWWLRNNNPTWCRVWKTIFIMTARKKKRWGLGRKIKSGKWETAGFLSRYPYLSDRSRWRISTPPLKKKTKNKTPKKIWEIEKNVAGPALPAVCASAVRKVGGLDQMK